MLRSATLAGISLALTLVSACVGGNRNSTAPEPSAPATGDESPGEPAQLGQPAAEGESERTAGALPGSKHSASGQPAPGAGSNESSEAASSGGVSDQGEPAGAELPRESQASSETSAPGPDAPGPAAESPAVGETASVPETSEPVPGVPVELGKPGEPSPEAEDPAGVAFLRRGDMLGAPLEDATGADSGTVEDVWIDRDSAEVVGVVAAVQAEDGTRTRRFRAASAFAWRVGEGTPPVAVLHGVNAALVEGYAPLFDGANTEEVAGEITAAERIETDQLDIVILKLRDEGNLLHRVLIEPARLVERCFAALQPGQRLTARGVLTRDGIGKLLVAGALRSNGEELRLRDGAGGIAWDEFAQRFVSLRRLTGAKVAFTDGTGSPLVDWLIDAPSGRLVYVCLEVDGVLRAVKWDTLERGKDPASWRLDRDRESLSVAPALAPVQPEESAAPARAADEPEVRATEEPVPEEGASEAPSVDAAPPEEVAPSA